MAVVRCNLIGANSSEEKGEEEEGDKGREEEDGGEEDGDGGVDKEELLELTPLAFVMVLPLLPTRPPLLRRTPPPPGGPNRFSTEAVDRAGSRVYGGGRTTNGLARRPKM